MTTTDQMARFARYLAGTSVRGRTADQVTDILREAILDGVLPPSSWLREEQLAEELAVSRTPVREALRRLAVEGLTVRNAHQGTVVAPMTMEDILAVYVVRESLEALAARLAALRRTPELAERLEKILAKMERSAGKSAIGELVKANVELHRAIRQASGNSYLERFLTQVEHAVRRLERSTYEVPGRVEETMKEHRAIVDAIVAGDAAGAEKLALKHMRTAREVRTRMLLGG